jgi:hypothetical protein
VTGANVLPQASVAVQVSIMVCAHDPVGVAENVEAFEVPLIRQLPEPVLANVSVLGAGNASPQANGNAAGAVMVGNSAGFTVIVLVTGARTLPQLSVAVHVSVIVPPQEPGCRV